MPQTTLVTGSSSGFGRKMVETLAQAGHLVFASKRGANKHNCVQAKALESL